MKMKRVPDQSYFLPTLCVVDRSLSPRVFHVFLCWPQKCGHRFDILDHRNQTDDYKKYCSTTELCCRWFKQSTDWMRGFVCWQRDRLRYHHWTNWVIVCLVWRTFLHYGRPNVFKWSVSSCIHFSSKCTQQSAAAVGLGQVTLLAARVIKPCGMHTQF